MGIYKLPNVKTHLEGQYLFIKSEEKKKVDALRLELRRIRLKERTAKNNLEQEKELGQ